MGKKDAATWGAGPLEEGQFRSYTSGRRDVVRQAAGSANMTAASKGAEDHPRRRQVIEDSARRLPPSPTATASTLHLVPYPAEGIRPDL